MNSREYILTQVKQNQPENIELPRLEVFLEASPSLPKFKQVLESIGGRAVEIKTLNEIETYIKDLFSNDSKMLSKVEGVNFSANEIDLKDLDFLLIKSSLGVSENGACWIQDLEERVSPFITQYLGIVINESDLVATMHQAYEIIEKQDYGFGVFIAGPSKTADIEQSLVLGAHGARGLIVFIKKN